MAQKKPPSEAEAAGTPVSPALQSPLRNFFDRLDGDGNGVLRLQDFERECPFFGINVDPEALFKSLLRTGDAGEVVTFEDFELRAGDFMAAILSGNGGSASPETSGREPRTPGSALSDHGAALTLWQRQRSQQTPSSGTPGWVPGGTPRADGAADMATPANDGAARQVTPRTRYHSWSPANSPTSADAVKKSPPGFGRRRRGGAVGGRSSPGVGLDGGRDTTIVEIGGQPASLDIEGLRALLLDERGPRSGRVAKRVSNVVLGVLGGADSPRW